MLRLVQSTKKVVGECSLSSPSLCEAAHLRLGLEPTCRDLNMAKTQSSN